MTLQDHKLFAVVPMLQGQIDSVSPYSIRGWAFDPAHPAEPIELVVTDNGGEVAILRADLFRDDLAREGYGDGRHGFECWLPTRLSPLERHVIRVFRRSDGRDLFLSPFVLEPSCAFGTAVESRVRELLRSPMTERELLERAAFFADVLAGLKQRIAEERSEAEPRRRARLAGEDVVRPRALVIDRTLPDATRDAGSAAILSHVASLKRLGYRVSFVPADLSGDGSLPARLLRTDGIDVRLAPDLASVEELLRRERDTFDLVYLHRLETAAAYAPLVAATQPMARILYSVADLHHLRLARQASSENDPELERTARLVRLRELHAAWQASAVVTHSTAEAELLREDAPDVPVAVVPWAVAIEPVVRPFAARRDIAFVGGFAHSPNVEAARRLMTRVMPLVHRTHPHIACFIIGSDVPREIRDLAGRGIEVVGQVPDLFLALNRLRLTVAPLRFGAGVKGKVLESLAHGLPCVMSEIAAEGMGLPPDLHRCIVGDDAAFARAIIELHEDEAANAAVAAAGLDFIAQDWGMERVDAAMAQACGRVGVDHAADERAPASAR